MATRAAGRIGGSPSHLSTKGLIIKIVAALVVIAVVAFVVTRGTGSGDSSSVVPVTSQVQAPTVVQSGQQVSFSGQSQTSGGSFTRPAGAVQIGDMLLSGASVRMLNIQPPEAHLKFMMIQATVQNVGTSSESVGEFYLKDSNGVSAHLTDYGQDPILGTFRGEILKLGGNTILAPGETTTGVVVFKILEDAQLGELTYVSSAGNTGVIPLK